MWGGAATTMEGSTTKVEGGSDYIPTNDNNRSLKVKKKLKLNFSSEKKLKEDESTGTAVKVKENGQVLI